MKEQQGKAVGVNIIIILIFIKCINFILHLSVLPACMFVCALPSQDGQKRVSDPLKLGLQIVVNH